MVSFRTFRTVNVALAALCSFASADAATAPNIAYIASGTFATPQIGGADFYCLRGQPFSIAILANEALKATKHDKTSAQYDNLSAQGVVYSCLQTGQPYPISNGTASLTLRAGSATEPDRFNPKFQLQIYHLLITVTAQATMPAGTIATPAIMPFAAPVALSPTDATVTYADAYGSSTTLGIAGGVLNAAETPPPGLAVLHTFAGPTTAAANGLVLGKGGVFYGTTGNGGYANLGTVFALTPPAGDPSGPAGAWNEAQLYSFSGYDGQNPSGAVVIGPGGVLYGTTSNGGISNAGTVYSLSPPASLGDGWTETVLHSFGPNGDGTHPYAALAIGGGGVLYGTTNGGGNSNSNSGTVFSLTPPGPDGTPPGGTWTESVLYSFAAQDGDGANPTASLLIGSGGALYGATYGGGNLGYGTVFKLAPGSPWTETVLYSFTGQNADGANPYANLTMGRNGTLYGTTQHGGSAGAGAVFQLQPPGGVHSGPVAVWTESVLYSFQGPAAGDGANPTAGLLIGGSEALYGATYGGGTLSGTVFKLTPPTDAPGRGGTPPDASWTETLLATFDSFDGAGPAAGLVWGPDGALYGTTIYGGTFNDGTVFEARPEAH